VWTDFILDYRLQKWIPDFATNSISADSLLTDWYKALYRFDIYDNLQIETRFQKDLISVIAYTLKLGFIQILYLW